MSDSIRYGVLLIAAFTILAVGCVAATGEEDTGAEVELVSLALTSVPSGVTCVQVVAFSAPGGVPTGTALTTQTFTVTGGSNWSAGLTLGSTFTSGTVQLIAKGFNVACASLSGVTPTWIADPMIVNVMPGTSPMAVLNFRQNLGIAASGNFAPSVAQVSVGSYTTGLRLVDGTVRMIGLVGQPTALTGVAELSVAEEHACARKTDGTIWCWGQNSSGQLGNGTTTGSPTTPVQATGISGATLVAVGKFTSCASTTQRTYCWGNNASGAVGNGTTTNALSPVAVGGFMLNQGSSALATWSGHTCAVSYLGNVHCWGRNESGQLGNGATVNSLVPVFVGSAALGAVSIAVGDSHTCAAGPSGKTFCWGKNDFGQLGIGTTTNASSPVQVTAMPLGAAEVSAGGSHSCARTASGSAYCWGWNFGGAVGDGSAVHQLSPVQVFSQRVTRISSSHQSSCAQLSDATVWCWGGNPFGQLGDNTFVSRFKPVAMQL